MLAGLRTALLPVGIDSHPCTNLPEDGIDNDHDENQLNTSAQAATDNMSTHTKKRARSQPKPRTSSDNNNNDNNSTAPRLRAACDECRTKKLKCTGEQPACSRCGREGITCVYSVQKRMGRPKKRARAGSGREGQEEGGEVERGGEGAELNAAMVFTPGGGLQPWLQMPEEEGVGVEGWGGVDGAAVNNEEGVVGVGGAVPGLTPDSSSDNNNSPSTFHRPPEAQIHTSTSHHHSNTHSGSTAILLDPSLDLDLNLDLNLTTTNPGVNLGLPANLLPSCACLSTMYLTLSTLQSSDPSTTPFPSILHPLREALQTASTVLTCATCPTRFITAIQNTQLLGTLLMITAERFSKVLSALTIESSRAAAAHETKRFRLADLSTSTAHLHTGGLGCAAAFSVSLGADEWRALCKKVVRAEIMGPEGENGCCASLIGVVEQMEERQRVWHERPPVSASSSFALPPVGGDGDGYFPKDKDGRPVGGPHLPKEDHICVKFCMYTRKLVEAYDWS